MADITMCQNDKCSKRNTCYRFIAKPATLQSYAEFHEDGDCYWDAKDRVIERLAYDLNVDVRVVSKIIEKSNWDIDKAIERIREVME